MSSRTFGVTLFAVALGAFVVRVLYVLVVARHVAMGLDALWYTLAAAPLAAGKGLVDPATFFRSGRSVATAAHPPLYPLALAGVTRVLDGRPETFRLVGAAVGAVTVALTGCIGRRIGGPMTGLVAAALAALYPSLIAVDGSLMSETIAIPLLTTAVLVALLTIERPTRWRFALLGILGGLTALARADAVTLGVLLILSTAFAAARPVRNSVGLASIAFVAFAFVVGPWIVRNEVRIGTPAIATTSTTQTISGANCKSAYAGPLMGYWDPRCVDEVTRGRLDEAAWSSRQSRQGLEYARAHADRAALVVVTRELRVLGLFHPLAQARLDAIETRSYRWQLLAWGSWFPVFALGTIGLVRIARVRRKTSLPLFAVIGSVAVTVAVGYGNQRFRTACEPIFLTGAAYTLVTFAKRLPIPTQRRQRTGNPQSGLPD